MKKLAALLFFALYAFYATAQVNWAALSDSIARGRNLVQVYEQLEAIKKQAGAREHYALVGRCWNLQLKITDRKTEDTLFWANSFFIDSLLALPQIPPQLRSVLYVLNAKRLLQYRERFFYGSRSKLLRTRPPQTDYSVLNRNAIDSIINSYFEQARTLSTVWNNTPVNELVWILEDPLGFLFKPGFRDIIYQEQLANTVMVPRRVASKTGLSLTPDELVGRVRQLSDSIQEPNNFFRIYHNWLSEHRQHPEIYYYLETQLRHKLFEQLPDNELNKKDYEQYLKNNLESPYTAVKVNSVYRLCLNGYAEAAKYNTPQYSYRQKNEEPFNEQYREYYIQTLNLLRRNEHLLDSFGYIKRVLKQLEKKIVAQQFSLRTKNIVLPNEPVKAFAEYKNINKLYVRLVRLTTSGVLQPDKVETIRRLNLLPAVYEQELGLPETSDYQLHKVVVNLPAVPTGHYALCYSDTMLPHTITRTEYVLFQASGIAVINNDGRVFVLNRKTGLPLTGAKATITVNRTNKNGTSPLPEYATVNNQGFITLKETEDRNISVAWNNDILLSEPLNKAYVRDNDDINTNNWEELLDYYEENIKLRIFTDRAIYRPGQTVFFKGIVFTRNPETGEEIIFNKKNIKFPLLKKLFNAEVKEFRKQEFDIDINDPFNRTIDTLTFTPNEYGSFTGRFSIPKNAPTGEWYFDNEYVESDNNFTFRVEEYKRPSFELLTEKPKNFLRLGDPFAIKMQLRSFAGGSMENTMVRYHVYRNTNIPADSLPGAKYNEVFMTGEIKAGAGDSVVVQIHDSLVQRFAVNNNTSYYASYTVEAEAIDGTGETQKAGDLHIRLSNRPVKIEYKIARVMDAASLQQLPIVTRSEFAGKLAKKVTVNIYRLPQKKIELGNPFPDTDYYSETGGQWVRRIAIEKELPGVLVYAQNWETGTNTPFTLPREVLQNGKYKLEISCTEQGVLLGEWTAECTVYNSKTGALPGDEPLFNLLPVNSLQPGDTVKWTTGIDLNNTYSIYHAAYTVRNRNGASMKNNYDLRYEQKGIREWQFRIPENAEGQVVLTHLFIADNHLYKQEQKVYISRPVADNPELIVEQYRKIITPGAKEHFAVTVKTKNIHTAAELMTTMYDASLDKLEEHQWKIDKENDRRYTDTRWNYSITSLTGSPLPGQSNYLYVPRFSNGKDQPLWWVNPLDYDYGNNLRVNEDDGDLNYAFSSNRLTGHAYGFNMGSNLNEVVVVGYGTAIKKSDLSSSVVLLRGVSSFSNNNIPLIIIDGVVFEGDLSRLDPALFTDIVVLKGADATTLYGSRAATGVMVVSTKGPVQLPEPPPPPITVRKNFSETAFFLPQVYAGADGYYRIEFTMPESVTEWKWKLLAHTKKAQIAQAERTIYTQLPMMVQPAIPRFLFPGDKLVLKTRISNLDTNQLSGTVQYFIEDAVTGKEITREILTNAEKKFELNSKSNTFVSATLTVPENFLHPLKIKITARAGNFSDGEEHIIPVPAKKILVTQNISFGLNQRTDTLVSTPAFPADAEPLGIGLYTHAQPQAALLNALPYLAFYPYNCAEQTVNKLVAHNMAAYLLRTDTLVAAMMAQQVAGKNGALPETVAEAAMPWLRLNNEQAKQQQALRILFDTLNGNRLIVQYVSELADMQKSDGGLPWFAGGESSRYISAYVLAAFGQINKRNPLVLQNTNISNRYDKLLSELVRYCDAVFADSLRRNESSVFDIYARSFWVKEFPLPLAVQQYSDTVLNRAWQEAGNYSLNRKALLLLASYTYTGNNKKYIRLAEAELESIKQLAITDEQNGVRWKEMADTDDLTSSAEETVIQLALAFEQEPGKQKIVNGILQWLLQHRNEHHWSSTITTASAIGLLQRNRQTVSAKPVQLSAVVKETALTVTNNLFTGSLSGFAPVQQFPAQVAVNKTKETANTPAAGGLNYYYFSEHLPPTVWNKGIVIRKQLYRLNTAQNTWLPVAAETPLHIADKIKTVITIETPRRLNYVLVDEKRAAALEPADARSGYRYTGNLGYYQSVRDMGYQFFAEHIPSGTSTIEYETVVNREGLFYGGPVMLQCMYQPGITLYGAGQYLKVNQ